MVFPGVDSKKCAEVVPHEFRGAPDPDDGQLQRNEVRFITNSIRVRVFLIFDHFEFLTYVKK